MPSKRKRKEEKERTEQKRKGKNRKEKKRKEEKKKGRHEIGKRLVEKPLGGAEGEMRSGYDLNIFYSHIKLPKNIHKILN